MLNGFMSRLRTFEQASRCARFYCATSTEAKTSVDKNTLSKLRKKTGYPILNCKRALVQFDNDLKQAARWLKDQAQKEGWDKATKLQGRPMSQGLVGVIEDEHSATVVEVNCETDFVAKNEKFHALVARLTDACHKNFLQSEKQKIQVDAEKLNSIDCDGKTLSDHVALEVGNLGENMRLRRAAFVRRTPDTVISSFTHLAGPNIKIDNCRMGKYGAVVKMEDLNIEVIARQLCQQVVGMNPTEIGVPVQHFKKKGKKKPKVDEEGTNEEVEDKEECKLLQQEFIIDPSITVQQYLEKNVPRVLDFVRFECGQDLGEDD